MSAADSAESGSAPEEVAIHMEEPLKRTSTMQGDDDVAFDPWFGHIDDSHDAAGSGDDDAADTSFFAKHKEIHLAWEDLEYAVGVKAPKKGAEGDEKPTDKKVIIERVSGEVRPGEILAIMGASGAGKTTLLNLLAGRLTTSRNFTTGGRILVNGIKRDPKVFKKLSAYVEQDDKMFGELKVEEQIKFSAFLRLPVSMSSEKKMEKVQATIQELGLSKVRDSYIGNELVRGVSGGERKRVNVGTELVADPSLLFLDEPTTGLDSFNALNVMYTLRKLASAGRTVVTTIHQPRSNIFTLFDKLLLLSEGRVMYFGNAKDAVDYFSRLSFACPSQFNPADYFIDMLSVDPRTKEQEVRSKNRIAYLAEKHEESKEEMDGISGFTEDELAAEKQRLAEMSKQVQFESSWLSELGWLLTRTFRLVLRERAGNIAQLGQTIIFALLLGIIWLNEGREFKREAPPNPEQLRGLGGIIFFLLVNQGFGGVFSVIFAYPLERAVVLRERSSSTYRVLTYMLARTIADIPRNFFFNIIFALIVYFMVGLRANFVSFIYFVAVILCCVTIAQGLTLCIATFTPDPQTSAAITPVFMILFMLFGGFFIDVDSIPAAVGWIRYLSFIFYGMNGLLHNQFDGSASEQAIVDTFELELSRGASLAVLVGLATGFRVLWYVILVLRGPKFSKSL
eukprot:CAMPEP_0198312416 /NCGR_PEP_ID=MMETSP1450-20131203/3790_1 /TAXON_ID=753684 ORGANISM="Madagascaria erythrocladiodes, Strain CCMP3234" /NCGR_SAMPLE_ID=MMETSP1450 /ASSEMBLY_ACC=CAM_ASM_001115 /LENGTH=678 /DNA_ID=CAMNT_0044015361 /DNA_START=101 /DNA_END=2137 /DNA_ORIENTATION=+